MKVKELIKGTRENKYFIFLVTILSPLSVLVFLFWFFSIVVDKVNAGEDATGMCFTGIFLCCMGAGFLGWLSSKLFGGKENG